MDPTNGSTTAGESKLRARALQAYVLCEPWILHVDVEHPGVHVASGTTCPEGMAGAMTRVAR